MLQNLSFCDLVFNAKFQRAVRGRHRYVAHLQVTVFHNLYPPMFPNCKKNLKMYFQNFLCRDKLPKLTEDCQNATAKDKGRCSLDQNLLYSDLAFKMSKSLKAHGKWVFKKNQSYLIHERECLIALLPWKQTIRETSFVM